MIKAHVIFGLIILLGVSSQKDGDEGRPYEFSFTIDGEQHRYEKKDINGIIQGEFGFITGDGVYHVTVYATDENGSFKILSMKNTKISEPLDRGSKPSTASLVQQPTSIKQPTGKIALVSPIAPSLPAVVPTVKPVQHDVTTSQTAYDFTTASTIRNGCSSCGIVTKAPPGPLNFQNPAFKNTGETQRKPIELPAHSLPYINPSTPLPKISSREKQQPSTFSGASSDQSINPENVAQHPSYYPKKLVASSGTSGNEIPTGLISKSVSPTGEPSTYPNLPPQTLLLVPGTNPVTTISNPIKQNVFGSSRVEQQALDPHTTQLSPGLIEHEKIGTPPSALSQLTISDGIIHVPGNKPIPVVDKYPNMVNGLPDGITERDISDLLYKFNYTVGFHGHYEKGLKNGAKIGGYFVNGRDGISRVVTYVADENGYRPKFKLINLGVDSEETPKANSEKKFGLKNFEFIWYPIK